VPRAAQLPRTYFTLVQTLDLPGASNIDQSGQAHRLCVRQTYRSQTLTTTTQSPARSTLAAPTSSPPIWSCCTPAATLWSSRAASRRPSSPARSGTNLVYELSISRDVPTGTGTNVFVHDHRVETVAGKIVRPLHKNVLQYFYIVTKNLPPAATSLPRRLWQGASFSFP
jgi:hypothetical protein